MIQRIQSIFIIFSGLCSILGLLFYCELLNDFDQFRIIDKVLLSIIVFSFLSLFSYKNRKRQIRINYVIVFINVMLLGFLVYVLLNLSGGLAPEKGIGFCIPIINIGLLFLANFYIKKDEKLIKSVDRFR